MSLSTSSLLLGRTLVIGFRAHSTPGGLQFNLITSARTLFPNKVTFRGSEKDMDLGGGDTIQPRACGQIVVGVNQRDHPPSRTANRVTARALAKSTCLHRPDPPSQNVLILFPTHERVPFRERVRKSNLFISPTKLAYVPNEHNWLHSTVL